MRSDVFAIDEFLRDCRDALGETQPGLAIRDLLSRVLAKPDQIAAAFEEPRRAELLPLYASSELTILKLTWAPRMRLPVHDHRMWAVIGIYSGEEHNRFYRRAPEGLVPSGAKLLSRQDTIVLGNDTVHAVTNPSSRTFTGAIHVYGGDFLNKPRSLWNPDTMVEEPATGARIRALFDAANERLGCPGRGSPPRPREHSAISSLSSTSAVRPHRSGWSGPTR